MSVSDADRITFKQRFRDPVDLLIRTEHTGFALMMITLPLLERFIRGRRNLAAVTPLPRAFFEEMLEVFPELNNVDYCQAFWQAYRHGILHQATFSLKGTRTVSFSGYVGFADTGPCPIVVHRTSTTFSCLVNPKEFAQTVLETIERDLEIFNDVDSKHPVAMVREVSSGAISLSIDLSGI